MGGCQLRPLKQVLSETDLGVHRAMAALEGRRETEASGWLSVGEACLRRLLSVT